MKLFLPIMVLSLLTISCKEEGSKTTALSSGIDFNNLDKTTSANVDFYQFACGGWMKNHPLTDQYARYGSFDMLGENNQKQLKELITNIASEAHEQGSIKQKIGDIYKMAMDSATRNANGYEPIKEDLKAIDAIKSNKDMATVISEMHRKGYGPYFGIYVGADDKNSSMNIVHTYQGGRGLSDRDYYISDDENSVNIRTQYAAFVEDMFKLVDCPNAKDAAKAVLAIETRLAHAAYDKLKSRNPLENYHIMTVEELSSLCKSFDWNKYFQGVGLAGLKTLNVGQPEFIQEAVAIINSENITAQKYYLQWQVINGAANCLSDDFSNRSFDFYGKVLSGSKEIQPRWKRAVNAVNSLIGEGVGQLYVEKHFPAAAKERMIGLVKNLQTSFGERIKALTWMGDSTKAKALEKLAAFKVKIGYPDKWTDYSKLEIKNDSYWNNVLRSNEFEFDKMIADAGKPVDMDKWLMTPQTVNAYYMPSTNEICFPAAILQYPFFDMNADDAFNYGAIGVVIGHEMTHGFDDQGRLFDKAGNVNNWWTEEDAANFKERTKVLVDFFNKIEVLPGLYANGEYTLGENIADYGGLQISFQALQNVLKANKLEDKDGFTAEQRFFLAYAGVWASNIRDEQIRLLTKIDVHSLGKWRVNATLRHIDAWQEAFNINASDPMYLAPEERASIW